MASHLKDLLIAVVWIICVLWGSTVVVAAEDLMVMMTSPPAGEALFGDVEIAVDLFASDEDPVVSVDFFVDDRFVDRLTSPPWTTRHNVGERPMAHRFEVVATTRSGQTATAVLLSRQLQVGFEVESALQQLYITAERQGQRVSGLKAEDFTILDNGKGQNIVTFEGGDAPMAALVLVDASSSMYGGRLRAATAGAGAFVDGMNKLDQAQLMLFSDRILHQTPFTSFPDVLKAGLSGVQADGGTSLNDHLFVALERLASRQGRQVIILLSDGIDVSSLMRMEEVAEIARRSQALVYWIRPGRGAKEGRVYSAWRGADEHARELEILEQLVRRSGGRIVDVKSVRQAKPAFEKILEELRQQYVIGFYPTDDKNDGSWHKIKVKVKSPQVDIRVREGYLDE